MRPDQWQRARTILGLAVSRPPQDRVRCITESCPDDEALRTEIETLLEIYGESSSLDALLR